MTIPKWLLPVLAIVAAIAVGVAATLIGLRFQPQETVETAQAPITAPLLSPLTPTDNSDPESGFVRALSDTQGTLDVAAPGTVLPDDLDLEAALDAFAGSSDPSAELTAIAEESGSDDPPPTGDVCAPAEGDAPEGCPEGLRGAIFALVSPPDFRVSGQPFPPTQAQYTDRGNPVGPLWCPTVTPLGASDVPFGILSSVPASFRVMYWPDGRGDLRMSVSAAAPDNAAEWETALADATDASELPPLQRCIVLPDLEPNTVYRAVVIATTPSGSMRLSSAVGFNSSGAPFRPPAEFATLGENYVFARAMHTADQRVEFRAYITNSTDGSSEGPFTTCPSGPSSLSAIAGQVYDVTEEFRLAVNAPSDYTKRSAAVFRVPEGADVVFCARWYPAGAELNSWERAVPLWESMTSFSAPDRILPRLILGEGGPLPDVGSDIQLTVSTTEGVVCGVTDLLVDGAVPEDHPVLCDPSVLATASARERDRRYWSQEFTGDLVLTTVLTKTDGSTEENSAVIPASRSNCFGGCELPTPQMFGFPVGQPDFDCGSSSPFELNRGACRPIAGTVDANLLALLTWTQGYTNGATGWTQSEVVDGAVADLDTDPKMDTDERFRFTTIDPVTLAGTATLRLATDRPVEYSVWVKSVDGSAPCQVVSHPAVISGSSTGETTITWDKLCRGMLYRAEVLLTDPATGATSLWTSTSLPHRWPGGRSFFAIPGEEIDGLNYSWEFTSAPPELTWTSAVLSVGTGTARFANSFESCVTEPDPLRGEARGNTILGTSSTVRFEFVGARLQDSDITCSFSDRYAYFNQTATLDLYTIMNTGEQNFTFRPFPGAVVHIRVWR